MISFLQGKLYWSTLVLAVHGDNDTINSISGKTRKKGPVITCVWVFYDSMVKQGLHGIVDGQGVRQSIQTISLLSHQLGRPYLKLRAGILP